MLKKELENLYRHCVEYLEGLRGIFVGSMDPLEHRLRELGFTCFGDDNCTVSIRILFPHVPTPKQREKIHAFEDEVRKREYGPEIKILFGDDIEYEVRNVASAFPFVPEGRLTLDAANNVCHYTEGKCEALFANIRAQSLRRLWQEKAAYGLLAQNLRYYVSLPRVDNAMLRTMEFAPENFWYLNNGVTIVCKTFKCDGNTLWLNDFSIVNGGQTTHNIGTVGELKSDFALPCKVIALQNPGHATLMDDDQTDFISEVCTATNSQKPVKSADAVANLAEIRDPRRALKADPRCSVYLITKINEPVDKKAYPQAWQRIDIKDFAKIILSFVYQYPCSARTRTREIFENDLFYHQIFGIPKIEGKPVLPPASFVRDCARLASAAKRYCNQWHRRKFARDEKYEQELQGLAKNGVYPLLACVGAIAKLFVNPALAQQGPLDALGHDDVAYAFLNPDAAEPTFVSLFDYCLKTFIHPGYDAWYEETNKSANDFSNFFKVDSRYHNYILSLIVKRAQGGFDEEAQGIIQSAFRTPTPDERAFCARLDQAHPPRLGAKNAESIIDLRDKILRACAALSPAQKRGAPLPSKTVILGIVTRMDDFHEQRDLERKTTLSTRQLSAYGPAILSMLDAARQEKPELLYRTGAGDDSDEEEPDDED